MGGAPEPVQSGDHERVTRMQCGQCFIQAVAFGQCAGETMVGVEVIAPDAGSEEVLDLPVGVLGFRGDASVSDQFGHWSFKKCLATKGIDTILRHRLRHMVARIWGR